MSRLQPDGIKLEELHKFHQVKALIFYLTLSAWQTKIPLRKHAYSNILKILPQKNKNFQIKNTDIFHTSAQNIDCGYSLEPPR